MQRAARVRRARPCGLATTYTQQQRDRVEAHAALGLSYADLLAEAGAHLRLECVQLRFGWSPSMRLNGNCTSSVPRQKYGTICWSKNRALLTTQMKQWATKKIHLRLGFLIHFLLHLLQIHQALCDHFFNLNSVRR